MRIDSYEIACVGYDVKSAAALVFYADGKTFTVVAHETGADDMDKAMATRDKIFKALVEGRDSQNFLILRTIKNARATGVLFFEDMWWFIRRLLQHCHLKRD